MTDIDGKKVLILSTHGFEQSELEVPRDKLRGRGATVHVATPEGEPVRGWDGDDWGQEAEADLKIGDARSADYDALVLPGGQINPDILRTRDDVLALVRDFAEAGKPVAAICHAPWIVVEAGLAEGREMTSYKSIRTDVANAGATWVDREVVVSDGVITSRNPDDLGAFVDAVAKEIAAGRQSDAA